MQRVSTLRLWLSTLLALALAASQLLAQADHKARETALLFLRDHPAKFGLTAADVADVRVTDEYRSDHNGLTHVWVQQQHAGIPVHNALFGLHVKPDGGVVHLGHRFVAGLSGRINTTLPSLGAAKAVEMAMLDLGFAGFTVPGVRQKINEQNWIFTPGAVAKSDIPVSICYQTLPDGSLRLAWSVVFDQINTADVWSMRIDAQTGEVLAKNNRTVYCKAGHPYAVGADHQDCADAQPITNNQQPETTLAESYNVFALPTESPAHGPRTLVVNPANPTASPYGWHDVNGATGAEYTYTRGNNVWAYDDSASDNAGSPAESAEGGAALIFDFPFDPNAEPADNRDAAITNLFYMNNMMHDITYLYGFDEKAGNFQQNNYGNGGIGGDYVEAEAIDGGGTDNANFATPGDGGNGRMQMYVWSQQGGKIITVNAPGAVIGQYDATASGTWGATITTTPVTGEVAIADDGTPEATLGCNALVNDVEGKIVMVDRGVCEFGMKALNAENAGAIGCIICNFEDAAVGMAPGSVGSQVTIPVVMMAKNDCDLLRQYAGNGLNLSFVQPSQAGPDFLDGDFDNGIIAHEYGHGISNRLTGGTASADCLFNAEQMGEGWSDWFTLITSAKTGDVGEQRRGVGTYVLRQDNDGVGIRRYPYSTDMSISPVTFATVAQNTGVHALGEIWAAVTWDLYWAMVEKYGFDADITNTNSGNGRAIQLVMDGMKMQPCGPGFIDGRDAIIMADIVNYNGADTCLISAVFARRGFGIGADQGSPDNAADGIENFDPIPTCIKELKITKETSTPLINPGDDVEFSITITNHKDEAAADVVVSDELPAGLTFVSASNGGAFSNGMITWNLGTLATGQVVELTYTAASDPALGSVRFFHDEMENDFEWLPIWDAGNTTFSLQSDLVKTGTAAWRADDEPTETDMRLEFIGPSITVAADQPIVRFWHRYNTEPGVDAGFIEIQRAGELQWIRLPLDKSFRNPYTGAVQYSTFAIPFLNGFSGNSNGWVQSYFDLSDFAGEQIAMRFRFGTDVADDVPDGNWIVDEVEMMEMLNYDGQACVSSGQGDLACAKAPERGVIVNPTTAVGADEPSANQLPMLVQPNPASDLIHITVGQALEGRVQVALIGADGREVLHRTAQQGLAAGQVLTLDVQQVPAGIYVVRLQSNAGSSVEKVVIR